jgi:hypothetical protein
MTLRFIGARLLNERHPQNHRGLMEIPLVYQMGYVAPHCAA